MGIHDSPHTFMPRQRFFHEPRKRCTTRACRLGSCDGIGLDRKDDERLYGFNFSRSCRLLEPVHRKNDDVYELRWSVDSIQVFLSYASNREQVPTE